MTTKNTSSKIDAAAAKVEALAVQTRAKVAEVASGAGNAHGKFAKVEGYRYGEP